MRLVVYYKNTMQEDDPAGFYTYIVRCSDDSFYTGWTVDLEGRISAHNEGRGAKYTRGRGPVELVASWRSLSKSEAMKLERAIKQLSRSGKLKLINESTR